MFSLLGTTRLAVMASISWFSLSDKTVLEKQGNLGLFWIGSVQAKELGCQY